MDNGGFFPRPRLPGWGERVGLTGETCLLAEGWFLVLPTAPTAHRTLRVGDAPFFFGLCFTQRSPGATVDLLISIQQKRIA